MNAPERVVRARTLAETHDLATRLALGARALLQGGPGPSTVLIGLDGDLGAGKTSFTQGFVRALAPREHLAVTSPTFAIVQQYATDPPVTHMDLYRLGSLDDLEAIGYRDYYFAPGITVVEWISRVPEAIPAEWIEIDLAVWPSDVREIRVRPHGDPLLHMVQRVLG